MSKPLSPPEYLYNTWVSQTPDRDELALYIVRYTKGGAHHTIIKAEHVTGAGWVEHAPFEKLTPVIAVTPPGDVEMYRRLHEWLRATTP